jgi:putative hydrolase of the HAD superfamily
MHFISRELGVTRQEAEAIRERLYAGYGTTLNGMIREHNVDPEVFLKATHSIDVAPVPVCAVTRAAIAALPGRKLVFTNSAGAFARRMISHLGLEPHMEAIFAIEDGGFTPKPDPEAYLAFLKKHGVDPKRACMFEDSSDNLRPARDLGMKTVWLHNGENADAHHPHVDHRHVSLKEWLESF